MMIVGKPDHHVEFLYWLLARRAAEIGIAILVALQTGEGRLVSGLGLILSFLLHDTPNIDSQIHDSCRGRLRTRLS